MFFYRKAFYNKEGGWYQVTNETIKGRKIYVAKLESLKFNDVPEKEQTCVEWDLKNNCIKKEIPNLVGENLNSIKIDGNYIVMLIYFDSEKDTKNKYSFCQTFPIADDENKEGPRQIKWEYIRSQTQGKVPNYVLIFPVISK